MDDGRPPDPTRIYGVDFSAAERDAGERTWIATGTVVEGRLRVDDVDPLVAFGDRSVAARDDALPALAAWLRDLDQRALVGLDFPFGLPRFIAAETGHDSWRSLIDGFPASVSTAARDADDPVRAFAERCVELTREHGEGTYDKRETDGAVGARSPYGFIADTITFHGMRDVLAPVIDAVRVEPMDTLADDPATRGDRSRSGPTLVETYPAAVFDALDLHRTKYKGPGDAETARRRRNAEGVTVEDDVEYADPERIVDQLVDDDGGDALDAVAACLGAYAASKRGYGVVDGGELESDAAALEGYIYALRPR